MGYESTLIVAELTTVRDIGRDGQSRYMLNIVATFDLLKMGYDSIFADMVAAAPVDPTAYWYPQVAWNAVNPDAPAGQRCYPGDIIQVTDPYGSPPTRLDFRETIDALLMGNPEDRRLAPCLSMLVAFAKQIEAGQWDGLALFHVGH